MKKLVVLLFISLLALNLEANPTFARQYDMSCSACHSQVPALNDMGLSFLRNGFRTSSYDTTALAAMLDANSSKRHYPVGAIVGLSDSSESDELNRNVKLFLSGTITDSLSLMSLSRETFNSKKDDEELFTSKNSQLYLQYNINEAKQAIRVGLLSPWTQLGNVKRSMSNSGLHGGSDHGNKYFSPVEHANVKPIKGMEYSYLFDNNILLLVSYGNTVDGEIQNDGNAANNQTNQNSQNSQNNQNLTNLNINSHNNLIMDGLSNDAFMIAMKYTTSSNYKIGIIYNQTDMISEDYQSVVLPIEKEFEKFILNSSLVYAEYRDEDYIGLETAFTVPLRDMEHIKAIFNIDRDENDDRNIGYSLGYTKIYDMFSFAIVASHVDAENYENDKVIGSVSFIF